MSPACRHFEICRREATHQHAGDSLHYCYLHYPERQGKNLDQFDEALRQHLESGSCDFRFFQFPAGLGSPSFSGRTFARPADFSEVAFNDSLNLAEAVFQQGLRIVARQTGPILLNQARINSGGLSVQLDGNAHVSLQRAVIVGAADLRSGSDLHLSAGYVEVHGPLSVVATSTSGLYLNSARLHEGFKLRVTEWCAGSRSFSWWLLRGDLNWQTCGFRGEVRFDEASFDPESRLDLTQSRLEGLRISGYKLLPKAIVLDATHISGDCRLEADVGEPRLKILAKSRRPEMDGKTIFANVNLSECRLVGNVFQSMAFSNIEWARHRGRWLLFDELVAVPSQEPAGRPERVLRTYSNIKEACQILKKSYRNLGDHVRSGDFHYGEMEMKRREYGDRSLLRFLGLEAWYCYLSGYGTRWKLALGWLAGIVFGSAAIYYFSDPWAFSWNPNVALKYSVDVVTLQRPDLPKHVHPWSHWVRGIEAVWGPVQIALFGLALRMRLRR